jgi:hypothetical protein
VRHHRGDAAAHHLAENVFENVGEAACGSGETRTRTTGTALLKRCVTETIIGGALLGILQRLVGFVKFLEFHFGGMITRILVGVPLHGELAEGSLELLFIRRLADTERFIKIGFCHFLLYQPYRRSTHEYGVQPLFRFRRIISCKA